MKLLKCLMLFALIPLFYSCSENLMNEEDPASALKAEQATEQNPSTEFVKSEHIVGYLDAQAEILYVMPEYQEISLQRLGTSALGENQYEISTSHADGAETRTKFSIVNVKERAMIYKLASVRDHEGPVTAIADDPPGLEPIEIEVKDYIIYNQAKCTEVWSYQHSPCTYIDINQSVEVWRWKYSTCQTGEDICIEREKIVRTTGDYNNSNCSGTPTYSYLKKMGCNTSIF